MAYEFEFGFTSREQFYGIVKLLNQECGKRNWTIRGKVLRGLKRNERFQSYHTHWFNPPINKTVEPELSQAIISIFSPFNS